jgi:REP element-mobilizing transposase RayT
MPCYLFTYHAYSSWMPDHKRGYVRRHEGILAPDAEMAARYCAAATFEPARFGHEQQLAAIEVSQVAVVHIECRLHFVATDASHIHVLTSWSDARSWLQNRTSLKRALTIRLKQQFGDRPWLCDGASPKRVRDEGHFEHLVSSYLPKHRGWKWREGQGLFQ